MRKGDEFDGVKLKQESVDLFIGELKLTVQHFNPKAGDFFVLTVPAEHLPDIVHHLTIMADMVIVPDNVGLEFVPAAGTKS
jgi:predicted dinucleotide-binding enzyme